MGKGDSVVSDILKEAKQLRRDRYPKNGQFDPQSSVIDAHESTHQQAELPGQKAQLIRTLNLFSHQYSPLVPTRVYGRSDRVPILNLTGTLRNHIVYCAGNYLILYDYIKDHQIVLPGHKNKIVTLAKDRRNKVFASGDWGPKSSVMIWDLFTGNPYQALPLDDVHKSNGICCLDFAGHLPFIGLLGAEKYNKQVLSIWPYETQRTSPRATCWIQIPPKVGFQHQLLFHPERYEFFVTTGYRAVVFYTWSRIDKKITAHVPKMPKAFITRMEKFTHSLWSVEERYLLTATMTGYIVVWDVPSPIGLVEPPDPTKNIMECKRCYKISNTGLTAFVQHNGLYVIGDNHGIIRFFDQRFHLLKYTKGHKLKPIYTLAFNELSSQPDFQTEMRDNYDTDQRPHIHKEKNCFIRDYTMGMNYYHQPSETTIERQPFHCPDFFVGVGHGTLYYYHLAEERLDTVVCGANSRFVGSDVNPVSNHLAMVTYKGEMHLYDPNTHTMLRRFRLFKAPHIRVTTIRFHPSGAYLFIGTTRGKIYLRRCFNWTPLDSPLDNSRTWISSIIFSSDGLYMAHYDKSRAVGLYVYNPRKNTWLFKGKQRIHCRRIVDLMFFHDANKNVNRLFSLGEDKRIVEYDIPNSSIAGGLKALTVTRIEQFSIPRSMTLIEPFHTLQPHIIIANNQYKMTIYDPDDRQIRRTVQGPVFGTAINKMLSIKAEGRKAGGRIYVLFVAANKIGYAKPPIDGNPYKYMAVLAHPSGVRHVAVSSDHKSIYTIGRNDTIGIQWSSNLSAVERGTVLGGSGITPFLQMLDRDMAPGKSLVTECQNCFYMLMLQKVFSTKDLLTSEMRILVKEIPSVIRFCGYFPTEYEIDLMIEEAEYAGVIEHGGRNEDITFNDFVKLFANHRRYPPFTKATYANAFRKICKSAHGDPQIRGARFKKILVTRGEKISEVDLPIYLPSYFKTVIRYRYESAVSLKESRSPEKTLDRKKKRIIRKEMVDIIKGKSFLDHMYSRSVPVPMHWKRDSIGKGKLNAIMSHLSRQKTVYDNFPAMGAITNVSNNWL